nr:MAG TPA: hypothetical protein [Caudoviricetes sp.]
MIKRVHQINSEILCKSFNRNNNKSSKVSQKSNLNLVYS